MIGIPPKKVNPIREGDDGEPSSQLFNKGKDMSYTSGILKGTILFSAIFLSR